MQRDRTFSPLFILVAIIAVVAALHVAKQILLPISLAVLLSFLFTPLANRFERWGLPRIPAVIVVVLTAFAVLGCLGWIFTDQLVRLQVELPQHRAKIVAKTLAFKQLAARFRKAGEELTGKDDDDAKKDAPAAGMRSTEPKPADSDDQTSGKGPGESTLAETAASEATTAMENLAESGDPLTPRNVAIETLAKGGDPLTERGKDEAIPVRVTEMPPSPLTQAQAWLGWLAAPFTTAGMVFVLVFFMLLDRENQRNRIIQLFGKSNLHTTTEAIADATHRVGQYLRMQFLINAGYGFAVAGGLWLIGIPSALMWGVLGFSLRFLPYLGPWLAAILPMLVALAVSDGWAQPILVAGMYLVYELVLNNVAEPMLYGSTTGVSTVGVILSAFFWTWLWGPIGLILAMPMTVCLVVTARYVPQLRFITVLLADQPSLSPAERVYQRLLAGDYHEPMKLAHTFLKSAPLVKYFDDVLIPALILAEQDRHAGLLNEEQVVFVQEAAEDLVDELGESVFAAHAVGASADDAQIESAPPVANERDDTPAARILCIPLRDEADETTSRMLVQLLKSEGFQVVSGSARALTSEMVDRVASSDSEVVVISVLPPIRPRDSRLLWRRLRERYPDLPIIVGYWAGPNATESLLPPSGEESSKAATSLAQAVALVRSAATKLRIKQEHPPVEAAG